VAAKGATVARVDVPDQNRLVGKVADSEQHAQVSDDPDEKLTHLSPDHPSSRDYATDRVRSSAPKDADSRSPDKEHSERDRYVISVLAEAHKAGLTTDHEYVTDVKRRIWVTERSELHGEIVKDLYANAEAVPCEGKAILAGGLPGAGKTSALTGVAGIDLSKYLMVNPDDIKEEMARRGMVPEIKGLSPMEATDLVHEESSDIAKRLANRAYADRKNVIWDVTMSSVESTQKRIANLRTAGYEDTEGIFVDIPVEVSIKRAEARHREGHDQYLAGRGLGGRIIPDDRITSLADEKSGSVNRAVFEQVKAEFVRWRLYDNSVDGHEARLAAEGTRAHDDHEEAR
jgi:hypothetical protein